jgi:bacterial leucyl aminopeptidase
VKISMVKSPHFKSFLFVVWLSLFSLACTLSSGPSDDPLIIEPRINGATATPQPPLAFSTPMPGTEQAPLVSESQQERIEVEMFNLLNQVQSDRMMSHIATLVGFHTRHVNSAGSQADYGVTAAADYIYSQFQQIQAQSPNTFSVFEQPFQVEYNGVRTTQRNIVGVLNGTDVGAGVIVVGAHYDSRTWDLSDSQAYAPGAADNGSGVAAVIEMARIMSDEPRRASIMFVLFAAEEIGAEGSKAFIREYLQNYNVQDVVMVNIDTIGSYNDSAGNIDAENLRLFSSPGVQNPNASPARQLARSLDFIAYNHDLNLEIAMQNTIDREGRFGDHNSFDDAGYPAVRFIEALEDTENREGNDTIDKIEAAYMVDATRTLLGILEALSNGPPPPRNLSLRGDGGTLGTLVWEPIPDAASYVVAVRPANALNFTLHFPTTDNRTNAWDGWWAYEAVAVAAVDAQGRIGRFSEELKVNR